MTQPLGHEVPLAQPFDAALARVRAALKVEGFGILTEIDLRQAFREKLGRATGPTARTVRLTDPEALLGASAAAGSPALREIARDAGARLARVVAALRRAP